ncbi:RHS repeat-associated core domain-containing protein [Kamptonema cortianum]|nr:RHS repeat-associated core domain-containing protein [Kamptonema cortianum]
MTYNGLDTRVGLTDSAGTKTFQRDGVGVTAPVLTDGTATFTASGENRNGTKTTFSSALKNTDLQTNSADSVTAERQYDAFGNVIASSGVWTSRFGNAGRFGYQEDADSGLKLLGHRYYDSSTGRFLTRDPIKDGTNWYSYCGNSPITSFDADGLRKKVWISGDRGGVEPFEFLQRALYPGHKRLVHPTDLAVLIELKDADEAIFWGHGYKSGGAHLYDTDYMDGLPAESAGFDHDDMKLLIMLRKEKRMKLLVFMTCSSAIDPETIELMKKLSEVTIAFPEPTVGSIPVRTIPDPAPGSASQRRPRPWNWHPTGQPRIDIPRSSSGGGSPFYD